MTEAGNEHSSVLELLGVNPHEKKMAVLRALLKASENEVRVGFSDIMECLQSDETEKPNKSLIYRLLSSLEDDGFIEVDRSGYRHRYCSALDQIEKALTGKREHTLEKLSDERDKLERQMERLRNIGTGLLVDRVIMTMTDASWTDKSRFGMGLRILQLMADREIYALARHGDIVRITVDAVDLRSKQWVERIRIFGDLASRGVKVRVLFTWPCRKVDAAWRNTKEEYVSLRNEGLDVNFRIRTGDLTYQMVARNKDVLVLTVAEQPLASICVPRSENPTLLDDVVESFDTEFFSSDKLFGSDDY